MFPNVCIIYKKKSNIGHYTLWNIIICIICGGQYCLFYVFFENKYRVSHRTSVRVQFSSTRFLCMIKYYKIHTFGLICCRIISGVLFTHVHIKFDDGWWHILYSVQPNTRHLATQSHDVTGFFLILNTFRH